MTVPEAKLTVGVPRMATRVVPTAAVGTGLAVVFTTVTGTEDCAGAGLLVKKPKATVKMRRIRAIRSVCETFFIIVFPLGGFLWA